MRVVALICRQTSSFIIHHDGGGTLREDTVLAFMFVRRQIRKKHATTTMTTINKKSSQWLYLSLPFGEASDNDVKDCNIEGFDQILYICHEIAESMILKNY